MIIALMMMKSISVMTAFTCLSSSPALVRPGMKKVIPISFRPSKYVPSALPVSQTAPGAEAKPQA